jgi:mannose-6-phosphate isomerase-like protein (cupin superfamily)
MKLPPLNKEALQRLVELGKTLMKYQACDCDPLDNCEHKRKKDMGSSWDNYEPPTYPTRCNCDASCGENRYHDVGDSGCRFSSEAEYDSYWRNRTPEWAKERVVTPKPFEMGGEDMPFNISPEVSINETSWTPFSPESMTRPWGKWEVLHTGKGFKVKKLEILVDKSISMQYHTHRSEHWTIIQGTGKVIVDGNIFTVKRGDTFFVPQLSIHKVSNTGLTETLIAIEVQMGDICEETDIVRV